TGFHRRLNPQFFLVALIQSFENFFCLAIAARTIVFEVAIIFGQLGNRDKILIYNRMGYDPVRLCQLTCLVISLNILPFSRGGNIVEPTIHIMKVSRFFKPLIFWYVHYIAGRPETLGGGEV